MGNAMRAGALAMLVTGAVAGAALAEPVDGKTAGKMLFSTRGVEAVVLADTGLSDKDKQILGIMFEQQNLVYYAAVAMSPGDGLLGQSGATNAAQNHHTPEAAAAAALAACNAKRTSDVPCIVVAQVLPKKWERKGLMLNTDATNGLKVYRKGRGEKAMAISPSTGQWAIAKGTGAARAALDQCQSLSVPKGGNDCAVAIAD